MIFCAFSRFWAPGPRPRGPNPRKRPKKAVFGPIFACFSALFKGPSYPALDPTLFCKIGETLRRPFLFHWILRAFSAPGPRPIFRLARDMAILVSERRRFWPVLGRFGAQNGAFGAFWPIWAPETVIFRVFDVFGPVFGPRRVPASAAGSGRIVRDARADRAASARALRRFHRVSSRRHAAASVGAARTADIRPTCPPGGRG